MMKFVLLGTLSGYKSGERENYITVKPAESVSWARKDDRQSAFNMQLDPKIKLTSLPAGGSAVEVHGETCRTFSDWIDQHGKKKEIEHHRFLVTAITPAKV